MAFSKEHRSIAQLKNLESLGFADMDGITIRECAEMIMTPADVENTLQNPKNISNAFGNIIAWLLNAASADPSISGINAEELLIMYLYLAEAPYKGHAVEFNIHTFNPAHPIDNKCIIDLKKLKVDETDTGMEKQPDSILQLSVKNRVIGMYYPKWKCFIPGTGFRETHIYGMTPYEFMDANPHVKHRCRAILTNMLASGSDATMIGKVLEQIGGPVPEHEMDIYKAELAENMPGDVTAYILATSPSADTAAVCGHMGTNYSGKLLDAPVLVNTGTAPMHNLNRSFKKISSHLVVIPPVKNVTHIYDATYECGPLNDNGIPSWIEFSAVLNGTLYHRIYSGCFRTCQPDNVIDLAYMVPDGVLSKYNYLIQESSAGSLGLDDLQTRWKLYPEDSTNIEISLTSAQYAGEWKISQRATRIDCMELLDADTGDVLGTVIPEKAPVLKDIKKKLYLSLDPAGATSVRLKSVEGTGVSDGLEYTDLIHPITPMAKAEFDQSVERRMVPSDREGTHFDSLLQRFFPEGAGGWSSLMVESRIWKPDERALFDALKAYPGTMTEAMTNLGVISNMKELLTRSGLRTIDKQLIVMALKNYIGTMLLEAILALSREGFAVQFGNLEFLISYPENGSGEGITKQMIDIIKGAIGFVNEYMDATSQLIPGMNVTLCSESEATAVWHQINPPAGTFIGNLVAAGTPDYGHSTHDFSLRVNGRLFMFSIPYAAQRITNATLAKVYANAPAALMRCFVGGSQELKRQAEQALQEAMNSNHGKLHERLGFILPLNRLFSNCTFKVTGVNADTFQLRLQELTEAKLNVAIPAYAYAIVRALKDGSLKLDKSVLLAPVGRGSLAINNTAPGFAERFTARLYAEINYLIQLDGSFPEGTEYTGKIDLIPNNDKNKMSVAQGMIDIKEHGNKKAELAPVADPVEHYLDLVYGCGENEDTDAKDQFRSNLDALKVPGKKLAFNNLKATLYSNAFDSLIDNYTYERFETAFERFGYTDIDQGIPEDDMGVLDETIRNLVEEQFENLCAQLKQQSEELIMSCPFIEEEMICSALIDLAIDRMSLFADGK